MSNTVLLGNIASLKTGPFGTQLSASEYVNEGIPVINVRNIGYGEIITSDLEYVGEETAQRLHEHLLCKGDIVFGRKGSVDRHAFIDNRYDGWMQGSDCIRVRINEGINPHFISHYLKLESVKKQINSSAVGSTMASLNTDILGRIQIVLPSLEIQNRIEELLSVIEEKIDLNIRLCAELEAMAKTLYDYWFVQFDFPDENGKPYRTSGGAMELCQRLGHKVPKGWEVGTLQDLVSIEKDGFDPQTYGDSIVEHYSIPAYDDSHYPVFESASSIMSGKYRVPEKAILFSKLNPQFKRIWDPPCLSELRACSTEFMVYLPRDVANRPYVYSVLNSNSFYRFTVQIASSSTGSRKRLDPDATLKYNIVLPPDTIVNQYYAQVGAMVERMNQLHIENHNLTCLRDWLLPMLMNGQAKVC